MRIESGESWRKKLSSWAIPKEILDQAPESPWIHPPALFQIPKTIPDSPSHRIARSVLPDGGSVLDIGCGGGLAAFAINPPAGLVIGVDHQIEMLEMFSLNATERGVSSQTYEGFWPQVSDQVPIADVTTIHNVAYNVQEIEDFLFEANSHTRKRVILELPQLHPLASATSLWKHFWDLDRPADPTHEDLIGVIRELGFQPHLELWENAVRQESDLETAAMYSRIRLCLPADREIEVLEFMKTQPPISTRKVATVWWDVN